MNSPGNDFGITFEGARNRGFFSSSRATGGRGWDKIYEFSYPDYLLSVKGWVYEQDGYELPAAVVYMIGKYEVSFLSYVQWLSEHSQHFSARLLYYGASIRASVSFAQYEYPRTC